MIILEIHPRIAFTVDTFFNGFFAVRSCRGYPEACLRTQKFPIVVGQRTLVSCPAQCSGFKLAGKRQVLLTGEDALNQGEQFIVNSVRIAKWYIALDDLADQSCFTLHAHLIDLTEAPAILFVQFD
ncbi:hypothetical protein B1991_18045 [Rhodanobacter lindaniclasticus]|uniref:Uncharacterized protein n=1 Tax=Rhodanobacter lindaniclasticus TaxID=75310 RepID=A0A4V3URS3_9GAMM|nr:hypothetical protein B1991_18045 [Rhodanobacter lindaniclasticus]